MGIHDWTKVDAGTYHGFHLEWLIAMKHALNGGLLPRDYYADTERQASRYEADILALQTSGSDEPDSPDFEGGTATATATAVRPHLTIEREGDLETIYALNRRTLSIRHHTGRPGGGHNRARLPRQQRSPHER